MKLVGQFDGKYKVIDSLDKSQLKALDPDFAWVDIDSADPKVGGLLTDLFDIRSFDEFGFPTIMSSEGYDTVVLNYYERQVKHEVLVFVLDKYVLTVHPGRDSVCDEVMATVDEMLVSGRFNSETILYGLLAVVVERHATQMDVLAETLRSLNLQLKNGITNVTYLSQLNIDTSEIERVFYDTRSQIGDILLSTVPLRNISDTSIFLSLYSQMNLLFRSADDYSQFLEQYNDRLIPSMWNNINRIRTISMGLAIFAMTISLAAIFYIFFPNTVFGIESIYVFFGILVFGGILSLIPAQKKTRFKLP